MKLRRLSIILVLITVIVITSGCSLATHSMGIYTKDGEWAVEPSYYNAMIPTEGLMAVNIGGDAYGKWGYIDLEGNVVIDFVYDEAYPFYDGYAPVMVMNEGGYEDWFYIDTKGTHAFDGALFASAQIFSEGYASVKSIENETYELWGFIDTNGEYVIDAQYAQVGTFSEGLAMFRDGVGTSGVCGYININNEVIIDSYYSYASAFSEGYAAVKLTYSEDNYDWGYINKNGEVVVDFQYAFARGFSEGLAPVVPADSKYSTFGYINIDNEMIIDSIYYNAFPFSDGVAAIKSVPDDNHGCGYINTNGELVIGGDLASCSDFTDGYAFAGLVIRR